MDQRADNQGDESILSGAEPNPRAFAIGTGVVFQTVGVILALTGCSIWGLRGYVTAPVDQPAPNWLDFFSIRFGEALWTLGLATTFLHGLALAAVGVGLQGERPSAGKLAVATNCAAGLIYAGMAAALILRESRFAMSLIPLMMFAFAGVMLALAIKSASALRAFPPPPDLSRATPEILAEYRRQREQRLRELDDRPR